jgi:hypothetical protein
MTAATSSSATPASAVAAFRRAVESGDSDGVLAALGDNVTFHNPVMFRAVEGLDAVRTIVPHLLRAWKTLRYTSELHGPDGQIGLIFTAGVGDRVAHGVDLLHLDEQGRIDHITVMVRPLSALQTLASEMAAALQSGGA